MTALTWIGIVVCLAHSAMFSGLNLGMFGMSRLRLEVEAAAGNLGAAKILDMRRDSHFLLTTILWGNVAVNCLLTLLSDTVLTGLGAFVFSTVGITFFGEITPQAYFSRHALRVGARLAPILRFYQIVLYPVARPSAKMLDWWLGREGITYFREQDIREFITKHIHADEAEIDRIEGIGALNFLAIDDLAVQEEGEPIDPLSIIRLDVGSGDPFMSAVQRETSDEFIEKVRASGKKWVVLTDSADEPRVVLDSDGFLRDVLSDRTPRPSPRSYCHRPVIVRDPKTPLGHAIERLKVQPQHPTDDVIDHDLILVWGDEKRVITGADLLGRLLRGIVQTETA